MFCQLNDIQVGMEQEWKRMFVRTRVDGTNESSMRMGEMEVELDGC